MTKPPKIKALQFGEGNFLRAFVDWMIDIANEKGITDIDVVVVPPRFRSNPAIEVLKKQNGTYHTILEGIADGKPQRQTRRVSCIKQVIAPADDLKAYHAIIEDPDLKLVFSNTTEAGIRYAEDDLTSDIPATFPGKVAKMLHHRWKHFSGDPDKGLIFVCCELIEDNGAKLLECVLRQSEAAGYEKAFIDWVNDYCEFCDSLVDRIVSGFPTDDAEKLKVELGYDDNAMVKGELYHIWAISLPKGAKSKVRSLLPLDKAGLNVLYLDSIKSFRDKKVRILNGSHTAMVPIALQLGCETVADAFNTPSVNSFIHGMMRDEVLPMISGDARQLRSFAEGILERFYNPYIRHMLKSIALNSLSKWEARNWPTASDYFVNKQEVAPHQAFSLASLIALYGQPSDFQPNDNQSHIDLIRQLMQSECCLTVAMCKIFSSGIFIEDFEEKAPGFAATTAHYLADICNYGMSQALHKNFPE